MSLLRRELSELTVEFLRDTADRSALEAWMRDVLADGQATDIARGNALRLTRALKRRVSGAYLARQDLSGRDLRFADLTGANLAGVRLIDADLTGANLTGALLVRPTLTGALLTGSRWDGAALLRPVLDDTVGQARELAAAAVPGRDSIELMTLPPAAPVTSVAWSPQGLLAAATTAPCDYGTSAPRRSWSRSSRSKGRWVTALPAGGHKSNADAARLNDVWWAVKLRRFGLAELDGATSEARRLGIDERLPVFSHVRPSISRASTKEKRGWLPRWLRLRRG